VGACFGGFSRWRCEKEGRRGLYVTARTSVYFVPAKVTGTRTY
jgi:hypothetical protein